MPWMQAEPQVECVFAIQFLGTHVTYVLVRLPTLVFYLDPCLWVTPSHDPEMISRKSTLQPVLPMGKGNQDLGHFLGFSNQTINVMGVNNL